ncbi:MAG: hypothetical protein D4S02_13810 [Rhodocyclaceae bacterium]|nr:MAG: hypothetical protein D4S02_13810 [Rhodocyclaceae bacterium]
MSACNLPSWAWRDPADALDRKRALERKAYPCRRCGFHAALWGIEYCLKHQQKSGRKLRICNDYIERKANGA